MYKFKKCIVKILPFIRSKSLVSVSGRLLGDVWSDCMCKERTRCMNQGCMEVTSCNMGESFQKHVFDFELTFGCCILQNLLLPKFSLPMFNYYYNS